MHGSIVQIFENHFFIEIKIGITRASYYVCHVDLYVHVILNCSIT